MNSSQVHSMTLRPAKIRSRPFKPKASIARPVVQSSGYADLQLVWRMAGKFLQQCRDWQNPARTVTLASPAKDDHFARLDKGGVIRDAKDF